MFEIQVSLPTFLTRRQSVGYRADGFRTQPYPIPLILHGRYGTFDSPILNEQGYGCYAQFPQTFDAG
jgi:hypothetical protein